MALTDNLWNPGRFKLTGILFWAKRQYEQRHKIHESQLELSTLQVALNFTSQANYVMPELLRIFGLRFFFYSNDHRPPHVHVRNADGEARFTVDPVECIENNGLKQKDIYLAESIIEENKHIFLYRWNEFFKED